MKSWMGGRRRRFAVERRDPVARQRQYFARRREQAHRNVHPTQNMPQVMAAVDSLRAGRARPSEISNLRQQARHNRPPPRRPQRVSNDFLLLANQSAWDSVATDPTGLRQSRQDAIHKEKRRRIATATVPIHASTSSLPAQEHRNLEASDDIRIFDALDEKTARYRRKTLPSNFLNSDVTQSHKPHRLNNNRQLEREARAGYNSPTGFKKWLHADTEPHEDICLTMSQNEDRQSSLHNHPTSAIIPNLPNTQEYYETNENISLAPIDSERGAESRGPHSDKRIGRRKFRAHPSCDDLLHGPALDQTVTGEQTHRTPTMVTSPFFARNQNEINLDDEPAVFPRKFPEIDLSPDSPVCLSPVIGEGKRVCRKGYESILAQEPIRCEELGAELLNLEHKLLNRPDRDVRLFSQKTSCHKLATKDLLCLEDSAPFEHRSEFKNDEVEDEDEEGEQNGENNVIVAPVSRKNPIKIALEISASDSITVQEGEKEEAG